MFSVFRIAALVAIAVGLAWVTPARATVLVDFDNPGNDRFPVLHVQFDIPTLMTIDETSTFTLNVGDAVDSFFYDLTTSGACTPLNLIQQGPCDGANLNLGGGGSFTATLSPTSNPDVFEDAAGGTLTFTQLAAVPEPTSLTLLVVGLAGLGFVSGQRRKPPSRAR